MTASPAHTTNDNMAHQLFTRLMRRTQVFREQLEKELEDTQGLKEFAPSEQELIQYTERWIERVKESRELCAYGDTFDEGISEKELYEKMFYYLDECDDALEGVFEHIDTPDHPTKVVSGGAKYLDNPYGEDHLLIFQHDLYHLLGGHTRYFGLDGEFIFQAINEQIIVWMTNWMKEYIQDKLNHLN